MMTWSQVREAVHGLDASLVVIHRGARVEVLATLCAERSLEPRAALRIAGSLATGSITVVDGAYVVRVVVFLEHATPADLAHTVGYIAQVARTLRAQWGPADLRSTVVCFDHYAA